MPAPEIFPGGQGNIHGAILAHPTDPNVVFIAGDRNLVDVRFPVQYVIRPQTTDHHDHRSYAGTVASGVIQ